MSFPGKEQGDSREYSRREEEEDEGVLEEGLRHVASVPSHTEIVVNEGLEVTTAHTNDRSLFTSLVGTSMLVSQRLIPTGGIRPA